MDSHIGFGSLSGKVPHVSLGTGPTHTVHTVLSANRFFFLILNSPIYLLHFSSHLFCCAAGYCSSAQKSSLPGSCLSVWVFKDCLCGLLWRLGRRRKLKEQFLRLTHVSALDILKTLIQEGGMQVRTSPHHVLPSKIQFSCLLKECTGFLKYFLF